MQVRNVLTRKEITMDELLNTYTDEQLLSELEKGHFWYYDGRFFSNNETPINKRPTNVENAVYFRFYS
jgi:hypothetical protein